VSLSIYSRKQINDRMHYLGGLTAEKGRRGGDRTTMLARAAVPSQGGLAPPATLSLSKRSLAVEWWIAE